MLSPKRVKFRKVQKGRNPGTAYRGSSLAFGDFVQGVLKSISQFG